ncbi:unnamed protein product [Lactuca virosa]|uniref:Uncharacterized protein n=1 Tax=Lactuca virosa TaxID=75947 RepID=A0AAU9LNM6_9ASTR|nr:unnamed protein product [Lactuca virosa]
MFLLLHLFPSFSHISPSSSPPLTHHHHLQHSLPLLASHGGGAPALSTNASSTTIVLIIRANIKHIEGLMLPCPHLTIEQQVMAIISWMYSDKDQSLRDTFKGMEEGKFSEAREDLAAPVKD